MTNMGYIQLMSHIQVKPHMVKSCSTSWQCCSLYIWRSPYPGMITSPPRLTVTYVLLNTEHFRKSWLQIRKAFNLHFFPLSVPC